MRQVILNVGISLDGYIARPNGSVDFLSGPPSGMAEFFRTIDVGIMGRKTLDAAIELNGGKYDGHGLAAFVMTRSAPARQLKGVTFTSQTPVELVAELRARAGKNIWLMGGGELAREFLTAQLVDEIHLGVVPVLIGAGIPVFPPGFPERRLELLENKSHPGGVLTLKYRCR